jgi:hypothetical protein
MLYFTQLIGTLIHDLIYIIVYRGAGSSVLALNELAAQTPVSITRGRWN